MASLGNMTVEIRQPLRKVEFIKTGVEGWLHGFFLVNGVIVALIELEGGELESAEFVDIHFVEPYGREYKVG